MELWGRPGLAENDHAEVEVGTVLYTFAMHLIWDLFAITRTWLHGESADFEAVVDGMGPGAARG